MSSNITKGSLGICMPLRGWKRTANANANFSNLNTSELSVTT
jgi:hypothetical protein